MPELKPRLATVHIYQGDVLDEIRYLEQRIEAAEDAEKGASPRSMADGELESVELRAQHKALVEQAESEAIKVRVRNLGRRTWADLRAKHPPRVEPDVSKETAEADAGLGVNEDSFFDEALPIGLVQPEFSSDTERDRFLEDIAPSDWVNLKWAFWSLDAVIAADPKPLPASRPTAPYDETRTSPDPSE